MNLLDVIRDEILSQGEIPFVKFMELALYAPGLGYYSAGLQKFGPQGDFVTAPELTPLFGQTLAKQCKQVFAALENPTLFEFGAGSGRLCVDILQHLEKEGGLPEAYLILEVSANLQQRQLQLIEKEIPHLLKRVKWLTRWPKQSFTGIIIANEVLDAMPVHRFLYSKDQIFESYITLNKNNKLQETFQRCTNSRLSNHVKRILPKEYPLYQSEVNLFIDDWISQCYQLLDRGAFFIIDYGFPRHEYYHPDRCKGTLMCHYQHQSLVDPLAHIGEQDITAHVDFTHVAEAAYNAGFEIAGYTNQASFLLANGLLSLLEATSDDSKSIKTKQAIKQLTHPSEMGELIKVIALTKNLELELTGFLLHDKQASL